MREGGAGRGAGRQASRVAAACSRLEQLAADFPRENCKDEAVEQRLEEARAKFRLLCSLLGAEFSAGGGSGSGGGHSW